MSHSQPTQPAAIVPPVQVTSPKSPKRDPNGDINVNIFFKVRNRTKKAQFVGKTIDQLKDLFMKKFQDERENVFGFTKNTLPPFYVAYPNTTIKFELENVADLYENAVLEIRAGTDDSDVKGTSAVKNSVLAMRKLGLTRKLVVVMVGLPARGKTYIARKVTRYLNWLGIYTKVFNVGQYRRSRLGAEQDHHFFDPDNEEGRKARLHMAIAALDDMIEWLLEGGVVGIYDATNSTDARRRLVLNRCKRENMEVLFIESTCEDPEVIERNIRDTKLNSPDYVHMDPAAAVEDFKNRISHYAKTFETIKDESLSYVQIIDIGRKVIVNRVDSYLASRIVFFLMNIHTHPRRIFLTRHGQSDFNEVGKIGGDSSLTKLGDDYAHLLAEWVNKSMPPEKTELVIFTSTLQRTIQTTQYIPARKIRLKALDEIDAGEYDGMTYEEIAANFPDDYAARAKDKLGYRYPRGESYLDVIQRLEPVIFQIERQQCDVLVVSHQAVLRCLLAYFMDLEIEECPFVDVPLHNIIQLTPKAYGCDKSHSYAMNKLSESELWALYQQDPRQLAEKARSTVWTQSAEDQAVWKAICSKRWTTKLPLDKFDQSNWTIPVTDNKEVDWRRYYIIRDLYSALEQDLWTVMEKQNAKKAKSASSRGGRGGRGRGGKARGGAKAAEAPKPVNKTETELSPKSAGTMLETIHAAMIDITSGKAAPSDLNKFLHNFADFSLDFLKLLVSQGNPTDNADIEKNNQKLVANVFVIWEDLIGEPEMKVINFFTGYNDKYIANLTDLLHVCLKHAKRSKMIVHLLLDNVVNIWESLAQFAVAQMMGLDGEEDEEDDEEDEEDDDEKPAKAKAKGEEHVHGENCNHDHGHEEVDDVSPVSDDSLHMMLKAMQDLLVQWPTDEWNADFNKVNDVDAPRPNQEFTEYVDKLSMVVGGPSVFNTVLKLVEQPLTDANADFKAKHAALFMLAVTCEASAPVYLTNDSLMDKVINTYIMPQLSHGHPDVVHAAVHTLSLMMNDLGPTLQNKYHATLLPALEAFLFDGTKKRNQLIAVASLTNFCEKIEDPDLLAPYLKRLFEGVLPLVNCDNKHIRERAYFTAAALSGASHTHFLPYREATLQAISKLLNTEDNEEFGHVLETICRIASYVVDDQSKKDVKAALDVAVKKFDAIRKQIDEKNALTAKPAAAPGTFNFGAATTSTPAFNFGAASTASPNFQFNLGGAQPAQPAADKPFVFNFSDLPSLEETKEKSEQSPEEWLKTVCVMTAGLAAKILGQDFAPYLDVYMKTIISVIENVEDVPDEDIDPFGEDDDDDDDMGGMKSAGGQPGQINPAAMNQTLFIQLNNKAKAVKALGVFAEHLGPLFAPHVPVAVEKAVAMLSYSYLEKVREKAASSLVSLYKASSGASDKDKSKMFDKLVHELINSVSEDPSLQVIDIKLDSLTELLNAAGPGKLSTTQVNKLFELMSTALEIVDQVAAESDLGGEEMEDDSEDEDEQGGSGELEEAEIVVGDLISLVEAMAKNSKDEVLKAFTPNLWVYQRMVEIAGLVKKKGAKSAVPAFKDKFGAWFMCCMVDAIAENIGEESFVVLEKFLPVVSKFIQADETDVAQAASFGIGVYAQVFKAKYAPYVKEALKSLKELIHGEKSQDEDFGAVIDNAVSSIGKLCLYVPEAVEFDKLVAEFLKLLPLTKDQEEAAVCHGVLIELLAKHATLDRLQLLRIFARLIRDETLTNEATRKAVNDKLNEWKSAGADSLKADIAKLESQAQEDLNKHLAF